MIRKTKSFVVATAVACLPVLVNAATVYNFSLDGWSDGGTLSGSFTAMDLNNNNQISSFDGEVTSLTASYDSPMFSSPILFDLAGLAPSGEPTGLVYDLDGAGTLGDGVSRDIEGLGIVSGDDRLFIGIGAIPGGHPCIGGTTCGLFYTLASDGFFDTLLANNDEPVSVTVAAVPLPASAAFMLVSLGAFGVARRSKR